MGSQIQFAGKHCWMISSYILLKPTIREKPTSMKEKVNKPTRRFITSLKNILEKFLGIL